MKRFLLLILAITAFNTAIYADVKTIKYKQYGSTYMVIKGNFEKQTLIDGDVSIGMYYGIRIKGKYEKGELIGEIDYNGNGFIVEVQGTISNNENGGISTKCKPYEWKCDLRTKVVPAFNDSNCTVSLIIETSPITINIPENEKSHREFTSDLRKALLHIQQDMEIEEVKNGGLYSATITFSDGLTYEGFVKMPSRWDIGIPWMSENGSYDNPKLHAKLTWPNGGTFEGQVYNKASHDYGNFHSNRIRPKRGTIRYHDGQVFEYSNSDFDNFKIGDNGLCVSPSEMKESFENTIREREEERLRKIREDEERKAAELRAKQEEEAKKIARKNELIRKYGQRYGEAIYKGEPKMGMTIEMIQDMHQQRGHMTRHISNGNEITVLSYGGGYVSFFGISGISASYRYTFVNGRLTEFTSTDAKASIDWL